MLCNKAIILLKVCENVQNKLSNNSIEIQLEAMICCLTSEKTSFREKIYFQPSMKRL
jgi:hypothetical protein